MRLLVFATATAVAAVALLLAGCGDSSTEVPSVSPPPGKTGQGTAGPSVGAPAPGGGLTIEEAMASTLAGPLMVKGYVVAREGEPAKLCTALQESYPPGCGGPSLLIEGLDIETLGTLSREGDSVWSDTEVSILGDVVDGVITASPTTMG